MRPGDREEPAWEPEPAVLEINGVLDLHAFRPAELGDLLPAWLEECRRAGITSIRIVHGKGIGHLRRSVHAILSRTPGVRSFRLAGEDAGGWGATLAELEPAGPGGPLRDE